MNTDSINAIIQTFELFGRGVEEVMIWYKNGVHVTHYIDKKGRHKYENSDCKSGTFGGYPVKGRYMPNHGLIAWYDDDNHSTFYVMVKDIAKVGFIGYNNKIKWVYKGE